jgi:hypothetical protein
MRNQPSQNLRTSVGIGNLRVIEILQEVCHCVMGLKLSLRDCVGLHVILSLDIAFIPRIPIA